MSRRLLAILILAGPALAGCGSSSSGGKSQAVAGPGFTFAAPAGWQVTHGDGRASAQHGSDLVQVVTFKLVKPYSGSLFDAVETELNQRMDEIAQETGGKVVGRRVVTPAGIRSHSYRVDDGDHVDEYTFVLRSSKEYQLLCRRDSSSSNANCKRLIATFKIV